MSASLPARVGLPSRVVGLIGGALVGVGMVVVAGCGSGGERAAHQASPESAAIAPASAPSQSVDCGSVPPFTIQPFDNSGDPVPGPATDPPAASQVVEHWSTPSGIVELRWPPDPRPLYGVVPASSILGSGALSGDTRTVTVERLVQTGSSSFSRPVVELSLRDGVDQMPPAPCDMIQVRHVASDGSIETVGATFDSLRSYVTLGPLIGSRVDDPANTSDTSPYPLNPIVVAPVPANRSIECEDRATMDHAVVDAPVAASPAEALAAFLQSEAGRRADKPHPTNQFREYHVSDGSVRYEHFVEWRQHVSVAVGPTPDGAWTVTSFSDAGC